MGKGKKGEAARESGDSWLGELCANKGLGSRIRKGEGRETNTERRKRGSKKALDDDDDD